MLIPHQKLAVKAKDIVNGSVGYICDSALDFRILGRYIPKKHVSWVGSARYGLCKSLSPKSRVGIPAFTCSVVLDAIRNAGCTPVFYDSSVITGISLLKEHISEMDTLILPYNMGFIPEIDKISRLCKQNSVELIEDCATAMGAKFDGLPVGRYGSKSVYSFNLSKGFFLGGLVASDDSLSFDGHCYPYSSIGKTVAEGLVASCFFNKHIYPLTESFLQSELHKKHPALDYRMPKYAMHILSEQFKRFESTLKRRRANASLCMSELDGVIDFVHPIAQSSPSWLYFVLLDKNRVQIMKALHREHVDVVPSYTFYDLSNGSPIAQKTAAEQMIFALDRPQSEIEYIIQKIKKVCR
jgi:dTDP-4-amino-4,6-dideoxygalactose transaminase